MICSDLVRKQKDKTFNLPEKEILACLPCGLVVLNAQGIIVWMNSAAKQLLGADLEGAVWLDVIQNVFAPRADDGHQVSLVDGRRVNVSISSLESLPGQLVTLNDMTMTRDYEQAKANQGRLMMIGRMTAQLAHQIRTPLSSAILYTDHLTQQGSQDNRSRQWLSRIQDCHASIEQQIEDLLLFARGEALVLLPTDLQEWSQRLLLRAYSLVETAAATFRVDNQLKPAIYNLHSESLIGALLNIMKNSLDAGASDIFLRMLQRQDGGLKIEIKDNGQGFSEDAISQAFTPFFTTKAQGNGLGLAVVHAVAKAHGGEVILDSSPGEGCCVTINLLV